MSRKSWLWLFLSALATAWLIAGTVDDYRTGGFKFALPRLALGIWFFGLGYALARTHSNLKDKKKDKK